MSEYPSLWHSLTCFQGARRSDVTFGFIGLRVHPRQSGKQSGLELVMHYGLKLVDGADHEAEAEQR